MSNKLLDDCLIRPGLGKGAQIVRQPRYHLGAPAFTGLALQDVAAHLPVQRHQLAVHGQRRTLLRAMDAGFQLGQSVGVAGRRGGERWRAWGGHAGAPSSSGVTRTRPVRRSSMRPAFCLRSFACSALSD